MHLHPLCLDKLSKQTDTLLLDIPKEKASCTVHMEIHYNMINV